MYRSTNNFRSYILQFKIYQFLFWYLNQFYWPEEVNDDGQICLHVMIESHWAMSSPFQVSKSSNIFLIKDVNVNTCLHLACNEKASSMQIREIVHTNPIQG